MKKKRLLTAVCSIALAAATIGVFTPKIIGSLNSVDTIQAGADTASSVTLAVDSVQAKPGSDFKIEVNISGVPSTGINCCEFSVQYNSKIVTVSKVSKGSVIGTLDENELYNNTASNTVNLGYASVDGAITKDGSVLVIEGKVNDSAKAGSKCDFSIVPIKRSVVPGSSSTINSVYVGYVGNDNTVNECKTSLKDGVLTVVDDSTVITTKATTASNVTTKATTTKQGQTTAKTTTAKTTTTKKGETTKATTTKKGQTTAKTTKKTNSTTTKKPAVTTVVTTPGDHPIGDVTLDGRISAADIVYLQNYLVNNFTFNAEQAKLADFNGDGKVNVFDAVALRNFILKK